MIEIIEINVTKCVGCAYCKIVCPVSAFRVEGFSTFLQTCEKCRRCIINCPVSAITQLWED
ncbi:MAG: ATP-binding protein [Candidatus Hodarchaeota archaeon]